MLRTFLSNNHPDIRDRILKHLDEPSLLNCRLTESVVTQVIDSRFTFPGRISDKKLRACYLKNRLSWQPLSTKSFTHSTVKCNRNHASSREFKIKKLIVGKLVNSLQNLPLEFSWDTIEEIEFTRAVSTKNYHAILRACAPSVKTIRINYLAIGGNKKYQRKLIGRFLKFLPSKWHPTNSSYIDVHHSDYFLPSLKSIFVDRNLDTVEYIENRNRNKFKYFDADLYFQTMASLIDALEKEVQNSILEMLRLEVKNRCKEDPVAGFFFTKPFFVNRFPMNTLVLNVFSSKLRV